MYQSVKQFQEQNKAVSITQKYQQYQTTIGYLEQQQSPVLNDFYEAFCEEFPFNHTNWNKYAQSHARNSNDLNNGLDKFYSAVDKNGKSIELWNCFCYWVKISFADKPDIIKKVYKQAVENIGLDYYSGTFWEEVITQEQNQEVLFDLYLKVVEIPMNKLKEIFAKFHLFIEQLSISTLKLFYAKIKQIEADEVNFDQQTLKQTILNEVTSIYQKTLDLSITRQTYISKIQYSEYDLTSNKDEENWRQYIDFTNQYLPQHYRTYVIQKCLISQAAQTEFWMKYFDMLTPEEQMNTLKKYQQFFTTLGGDIIYFQIDQFEAQEQHNQALELLRKLQFANPENIKPFMRHLQLEIRRKNNYAVDQAFTKLEKNFSKDKDALSYITYEQAMFQAKHKNKKEYGLQILARALRDNDSKQLFAYLLQYLQQFYEAPHLLEKIDEIVLNELQTTKNKDFQAMLRQFARNQFKYISDVLSLEQKLRQINSGVKTFGGQQSYNSSETLNKRANPEVQNGQISQHDEIQKIQKIDQN